MTNELLAEYIQQGGNDELIPILWEKIRKILYIKSEQVFQLHKESCVRRGVDVWDIQNLTDRCISSRKLWTKEQVRFSLSEQKRF